MPASPDPTTAEITAALRAAGCVFAEDEAHLLLTTAHNPTDLTDMVERRTTGTPLEHVLGWVRFYNLRITVDPGVFVPRKRTELLVHHAAALAPAHPVIADLCCGTGAVGRALAETLARAELYAADIDPTAVDCARRNTADVGGHVFEGDLDEPLPTALRGRIDILVANTPYVPTDAVGTMPPEARLHEPRAALDGGADGLDIQRRLAAIAPRWLAPGGHLLVETSRDQAPQTAEEFAGHGLRPHVAHSDELDATVVIGTHPTHVETNR